MEDGKRDSEVLREMLFVLKRIEQQMRLNRSEDPLYFLDTLPEDPQPSAVWDGPIAEFLEAHQMKVLRVNEPREEDWVTEPIAIEMGRNWRTLAPLMSRLKRSMNKGDSVRMELNAHPGRAEQIIRSWLAALERIAFIEGYSLRSVGAKLRIVIDPARHSDAIGFLTGGWLEQFAIASVRLAMKQLGLFETSEILAGVQVELPNGDPAELDLLLRIGGEIFWLEAKTGAYQRHLPKYARFADMLGLDEEHAFLILADPSPQTHSQIEGLYGIQPLPIHLFEHQFISKLTTLLSKPKP